MKGGYEILEHTADVGIRAFGPTLAACFEQAARALAEILGASRPGRTGERRVISATGGDRGALLVDFLNELLLVHETDEVAFTDITVTRLDEHDVEAEVHVVRLEGEAETTGVKAATYHRLEIRETADGYEARVYLDV
jgi:protein archease